MFKKANKKGFTLIELIIVVAIMAVLVALLAPNVLKYLEKSKVGKDQNSLDSVRLGIEAELMDEKLSSYTTDDASTADKIEGKDLSALNDDSASADEKALYARLVGETKVLDEKFATTEIFSSKTAKGGHIRVYVDGNGGVAVAAVNAEGDIIAYDGVDIIVSTKFSEAEIAKLDCK